MENETRVFGKFVWLIIVLCLFAYLYLFQYDGNIGKEYLNMQDIVTNQEDTSMNTEKTTQFIEISSHNNSKKTSDNVNIVNRRTNENLDEKQDIIVFDSGEAVIVKNGAIIYDGKLIIADNENPENSEVRYLDSPMRIITTN